MFLILFLAGFSTFQAAQSPAPSIRNFLRVNDQFCTGGQPTLEALAELKAGGIKAIINLRPPVEHRAAEEEARARELGLRYFNIPVVYTDPKDAQVDELRNSLLPLQNQSRLRSNVKNPFRFSL